MFDPSEELLIESPCVIIEKAEAQRRLNDHFRDKIRRWQAWE